jgi:hypothetical protein
MAAGIQSAFNGTRTIYTTLKKWLHVTQTGDTLASERFAGLN